jgi:hypothetical protein
VGSILLIVGLSDSRILDLRVDRFAPAVTVRRETHSAARVRPSRSQPSNECLETGACVEFW